MRWLISSIAILSSCCSTLVDARTPIHEPGRCAIRGQCGKKSFFGGDLPCEDNGLAEKPDDVTRSKLVALCGEKWRDSDVCCREDQVCLSCGW